MFIHAHTPALEAQVERLCRPWLARRPVIVQSAAGTVVSAWPRTAGIEPGLSAWEAKLRCPEAALFPGDEQKYPFFWEKACEVAAKYSPSLREEPCHRVCLDMAGTQKLFGPPERAAASMLQEMKRLGLTARVGVGGSRIMARLAADTARDGIGKIAPQESGELPINILPDLDPRVHGVLRDLGLSTFSDVRAIPAPMLRAAFGEAGERLGRAVRGRDSDAPSEPAAEETLRLSPATDDMDALRGALMSLAESLGRSLRRSGLAAGEIRLRIGLRTSREQSFNVSALAANEVKAVKVLQNATASDEDLFRAAAPALARVRRPVRLLALEVLRAVREHAAGQLYLPPLRPRALDRALDQIKDRYGEAALRRAITTTQAQLGRDE